MWTADEFAESSEQSAGGPVVKSEVAPLLEVA